MRSPLCSSPLRSAGPPVRMKEMKIPSPSSPPTMLKPRPVKPRCSTTRRGFLLHTRTSVHAHRGAHTHAHTHTHTGTRTHTNTHLNTYTHTHTHTHSPLVFIIGQLLC